jgi:hypothetical protein
VIDVHYEKAFQSDIVKRVSRLFIENAIARPSRESLPTQADTSTKVAN